jgi:hypothetical protein
MRESLENGIECDRLLADYIVALRALRTAADRAPWTPEDALLEARRQAQETLRPLLRHQYTHQDLVEAVNSHSTAASQSWRPMHG